MAYKPSEQGDMSFSMLFSSFSCEGCVVLSRVCLFVYLFCLIAASREGAVRLRRRLGAEDRQVK
jgi:hypothetical protein